MQKTAKSPREREQARAYIFEISSGLVEVAKQHELRFLTYLLEMAALAAAEGARSVKGRRG